MRSIFSIVKIHPEKVILRDEFNNSMSTMTVTNDAEAVVEYILKLYPHKRIFYYDTEGMLDELMHDGEQFRGFKVGPRTKEEVESFGQW